MDGDDFNSKTDAFMAWLSNTGVVLNPKVALVDLRSVGRGRGVGQYISSFKAFRNFSSKRNA